MLALPFRARQVSPFPLLCDSSSEIEVCCRVTELYGGRGPSGSIWSCYGGENGGTEKERDLPRASQPFSGEICARTQISWFLQEFAVNYAAGCQGWVCTHAAHCATLGHMHPLVGIWWCPLGLCSAQALAICKGPDVLICNLSEQTSKKMSSPKVTWQ